LMADLRAQLQWSSDPTQQHSSFSFAPMLTKRKLGW